MTFGCILLSYGEQRGPSWATAAGGILLGGVLLAPGLLLLVRPNLAVTWLETFLHAAHWRPPYRRFEPTVPPQWSRWPELSLAEKLVVWLAAGGCFLVGVLLVYYGMVTP